MIIKLYLDNLTETIKNLGLSINVGHLEPKNGCQSSDTSTNP